jgi:hypothetical protein
MQLVLRIGWGMGGPLGRAHGGVYNKGLPEQEIDADIDSTTNSRHSAHSPRI